MFILCASSQKFIGSDTEPPVIFKANGSSLNKSMPRVDGKLYFSKEAAEGRVLVSLWFALPAYFPMSTISLVGEGSIPIWTLQRAMLCSMQTLFVYYYFAQQWPCGGLVCLQLISLWPVNIQTLAFTSQETAEPFPNSFPYLCLLCLTATYSDQ